MGENRHIKTTLTSSFVMVQYCEAVARPGMVTSPNGHLGLGFGGFRVLGFRTRLMITCYIKLPVLIILLVHLEFYVFVHFEFMCWLKPLTWLVGGVSEKHFNSRVTVMRSPHTGFRVTVVRSPHTGFRITGVRSPAGFALLLAAEAEEVCPCSVSGGRTAWRWRPP